MSTTTKSPLQLARRALRVASRALPPYSHRFSPRSFTQPQLFACLALKAFFRTDYRGASRLLADLPCLRRELGLRFAPHFTTLHKAARRLLSRPRHRRLLAATVHRCLGRRRRVARVALDSTGLDLGRASRYFVRRQGERAARRYRGYAKLELAVDTASHLVVGSLEGRGPRPDADRFVPLLGEAMANVRPARVVADAGYDSEANHEHARGLGAPAFIPAAVGRPSARPPAGRHRRRMRARLDKRYGGYGQRWQAESVNSMVKRRLGSAAAGHGYHAQCRDLRLLVLTHNLMLDLES
jgi:hypothetical protein